MNVIGARCLVKADNEAAIYSTDNSCPSIHNPRDNSWPRDESPVSRQAWQRNNYPLPHTHQDKRRIWRPQIGHLTVVRRHFPEQHKLVGNHRLSARLREAEAVRWRRWQTTRRPPGQQIGWSSSFRRVHFSEAETSKRFPLKISFISQRYPFCRESRFSVWKLRAN